MSDTPIKYYTYLSKQEALKELWAPRSSGLHFDRIREVMKWMQFHRDLDELCECEITNGLHI